MATETQKKQLLKSLKDFKKKYLVKKYADLDESATRLMINAFLTDVLGYTELEEIKTEYAIKGTYADYVIQLERKKHFIVEVKAIQLDLSEKHLGQAVNYAANEGVDWILLSNGRQIQLYKVIFGKPISHQKIFTYDLTDPVQLKASVEFLVYMTKRSILKDELDQFWTRFQALLPSDLCQYLYSVDVVRLLKRALKADTGLSFSEEDVFNSIHQIIIEKIASDKPRGPVALKKRRKSKEPEIKQEIKVEEPKLPIVDTPIAI